MIKHDWLSYTVYIYTCIYCYHIQSKGSTATGRHVNYIYFNPGYKLDKYFMP